MVSTHCLMTPITSSHSPSMFVNIALVSFGSPLARTMRTASATSEPTDSPAPSGVTEKAAIMRPWLQHVGAADDVRPRADDDGAPADWSDHHAGEATTRLK